ncbi:hypothetical protein ACE01N_20060 [Saccharicrinis sp. FJH2]|uniref:hypothetical protein n=1 Tax=Saccharicrinis sp. FJH65 TaxID=3344659 RepID=UPI0035F469D6
MILRTKIKIQSFLMMFFLWSIVVWFDYIIIFTDYSIDKNENIVLVLLNGFIVFYTFMIIKYFKIVKIEKDSIKISYWIPLFNKRYRLQDLIKYDVELNEGGFQDVPRKNIVLIFKDSKKINISDFSIANFERFETAIDWLINNKDNTIDTIPADYKVKHSISRVKFDISQINFKLFGLIFIGALVTFGAGFAINKMIHNRLLTGAEKTNLFLWLPIMIFLIFKIYKKLTVRKKLKLTVYNSRS